MATGLWTKEQVKLAFHLYCQIPYGRIYGRNPEIIALARVIGRTSDAVAMKMLNIASLDPAITGTYQGKPLSNANTRAWQAARRRAGIEDFRWHDLRHTWATWQRQAGTPTHELQSLSGWRTGAMVERYAHLAPDHLSAAATRLDSVLPSYVLATEHK